MLLTWYNMASYHMVHNSWILSWLFPETKHRSWRSKLIKWIVVLNQLMSNIFIILCTELGQRIFFIEAIEFVNLSMIFFSDIRISVFCDYCFSVIDVSWNINTIVTFARPEYDLRIEHKCRAQSVLKVNLQVWNILVKLSSIMNGKSQTTLFKHDLKLSKFGFLCAPYVYVELYHVVGWSVLWFVGSSRQRCGNHWIHP